MSGGLIIRWLTLALFACQATFAADDITWLGSVTLKNNYVVSTGLELDDGPGLQYWTMAKFENGFYADVFANIPLTPGNPNNAAEIDYTIGYSHRFDEPGERRVDVQVSYYDIERPDLFDSSGNVIVPKVKFVAGDYQYEAMYFVWDDARNAIRLGAGRTFDLGRRNTLLCQLDYVDGPFSAQEVVIGKVRFTHRLEDAWLDRITVDAFDLVYQENSADKRDFTVTVGLSKSLF